MAKRLPPHLSYKSALTLLPPADILPPIEAIRRVHDKNFTRWPAHINLLYPFLASPSETVQQGADAIAQLKTDVRLRIEEATKRIRPFNVLLSADPPGIFHHNPKSKTVWLGPSTSNIQELQAALQAEFSECDDDQRPFTPHLSLGQAHSEHSATRLGEEITRSIKEFLTEITEDAPIALEWNIDRVFVIERKGYKDRFKVIGVVPLLNN